MNLGDIGKRVRLRRVELGLTQAELADNADVALGTVQALEDAANRKHPRQTSPENLEKIAKALKRTLNDLIKGSEPIAPNDPRLEKLGDEDLEVARLFHDLSTPRRLRVLSVLRGAETDRVASIATRLTSMQAMRVDIVPQIEQLISAADRRATAPPVVGTTPTATLKSESSTSQRNVVKKKQ
jgi:transcriptional regulator with XRE-family HTH domain